MSLQEIGFRMKNKYNRINLLQCHHINTVKYQYLKMGSNISDIEDFCDFKRVSIRTQHPNYNVWLPKWINIDMKDAIEILPNIINKYDVLIANAIDSSMAIKRGNIAVLENCIIVEIAYGEGTVDKVNHEGVIDKRWITTKAFYNKDIDDEDILDVFLDILKLPYINVIIEFSCFSVPVGIFNKKYVAWDIED